MKIKEVDYSLSDGFAYATFEDAGEEYIVQACLREREECKNENRRYQLIKNGINIYKKEIDSNNPGIDEGICGDANEKCFKKYGEEKCWKIFTSEVRKIGIRIK